MLVVETFMTRLQSQEQLQGICTLIPKLQTPASLEKTLMLGKTEGKRRRGRPGSWACCGPWDRKELDTT